MPHSLFTLVIVALALPGCDSCRANSQPAAASGPCDTFETRGATVVEVRLAYPGASPADIENGVVINIEEAVGPIDGVAWMLSTAGRGEGHIRVVLDGAISFVEALADVSSAVELGVRTAPEALERPIVLPVVGESERLTAVVRGDLALDDLSHVAEELSLYFERVPGVMAVRVVGAARPRVMIQLDPARLTALGLTADEVAAAIRSHDLALPGGSIDSGLLPRTMRADSSDALGTLGDIVLRNDGLRLADVAELRSDSFATPFVRLDGEPAVMLSVWARELPPHSLESGSGPTSLGPELDRALSQAAADLVEQLPPGTTVELIWPAEPSLVVEVATASRDVEVTSRIVEQLADQADRLEGVAHVLVEAGRLDGGQHFDPARGRLRIVLSEGADLENAQSRLRAGLSAMPGAAGSVRPLGAPVFSLAIVGGTDEERERAATSLASALRSRSAIAHVVAPSSGRPELTITPRREALAALGITVEQLVGALRWTTSPGEVGSVNDRPVVMSLGEPGGDAELLDVALNLRGQDGRIQTTPLSAVADISRAVMPSTLTRLDAEGALLLDVVPSGVPDGALCAAIESAWEAASPPAGLRYQLLVVPAR